MLPFTPVGTDRHSAIITSSRLRFLRSKCKLNFQCRSTHTQTVRLRNQVKGSSFYGTITGYNIRPAPESIQKPVRCPNSGRCHRKPRRNAFLKQSLWAQFFIMTRYPRPRHYNVALHTEAHPTLGIPPRAKSGFCRAFPAVR